MRMDMPRVHVHVHATCACACAAVCGPYTRLDIVVVALGDGVSGLEGGADDQPRRQQLRRHRLAWWWDAAKQVTSASWAAAPYRSSLITRLSPECTTPVSSPGTNRVLRVLGLGLRIEQGLEIAPDCTTGSSRITPVSGRGLPERLEGPPAASAGGAGVCATRAAAAQKAGPAMARRPSSRRILGNRCGAGVPGCRSLFQESAKLALNRELKAA